MLAPLKPMYSWLADMPGTKLVLEFLKIHGLKEIPGDGDEDKIIQMAKDLGIDGYLHDSTPWCGLLMAWLVKQTGREPVRQPLWALNWAKWGVNVDKGDERYGDIGVFKRVLPNGGTAGHVGIIIGEDNECFHLAAGNQGDAASIGRIAKNRLFACRRPAYTSQPEYVKKVILNKDGEISSNEQ